MLGVLLISKFGVGCGAAGLLPMLRTPRGAFAPSGLRPGAVVLRHLMSLAGQVESPAIEAWPPAARHAVEEGGSVLGMLDGPDVAVALQGGVRTRSDAWEFVRWFADAWMGRPVDPEDGFSADELAVVEADLGFELPTA